MSTCLVFRDSCFQKKDPELERPREDYVRGPQDPQIKLNGAQVAFDNGDLDGASLHLDGLTEDHWQVWNLRLSIAIARQNGAEAKRLFDLLKANRKTILGDVAEIRDQIHLLLQNITPHVPGYTKNNVWDGLHSKPLNCQACSGTNNKKH